jgi:hypothetical protein
MQEKEKIYLLLKHIFKMMTRIMKKHKIGRCLNKIKKNFCFFKRLIEALQKNFKKSSSFFKISDLIMGNFRWIS